jgi:WD40 repeat protein
MTGEVRIDPSGKHFFLNSNLVFRLDPGHFQPHKLPERLPSIGFASDEGSYLLLDLPDGSYEMVRAGEWKPLFKIPKPQHAPRQLHVSANGDRAAIVSDDRSVTVYEVHSGKEIRRFYEDERFTAADLSPDGKTILTGNLFGGVKIWSVDTGQVLFNTSGHTRTVLSAAYSPDGRFALTAGDDETARMWDTATGAQKLVFNGHSQTVYDAEFSPDMKRIVTASRDLTARVWDASTGRGLLVLDGHDGEVLSAAFTPDNHHIVTSSADGTIRVWIARSD